MSTTYTSKSRSATRTLAAVAVAAAALSMLAPAGQAASPAVMRPPVIVSGTYATVHPLHRRVLRKKLSRRFLVICDGCLAY